MSETHHRESVPHSFLNKILNRSKNMMFPKICLLCAMPGLDLCETCSENLELVGDSFCPVCGLVFARGVAAHVCVDCTNSKPFFDQHRSLYVFDGPVRQLMHRLKYSADFAVLGWIETQWQMFGVIFDNVDLIVPIPLTNAKLKQRGFNQSLELAKLYSRDKTHKASHDVLTRVKETVSQTGLNRDERFQNLQDAFRIADKTRVQAKSVLLIDDVFTTGATINAAAKVLKQAGAARVFAMTVARGRL